MNPCCVQCTKQQVGCHCFLRSCLRYFSRRPDVLNLLFFWLPSTSQRKVLSSFQQPLMMHTKIMTKGFCIFPFITAGYFRDVCLYICPLLMFIFPFLMISFCSSLELCKSRVFTLHQITFPLRPI